MALFQEKNTSTHLKKFYQLKLIKKNITKINLDLIIHFSDQFFYTQ